MELQLTDIIAKGIGIFILLSIAAGLIFGIVCLVRLLLKLKKLNRPIIIFYYFLMVLCVISALTSWIMNMGWYRFFLTFLLFPIIHAVIFVTVNIVVLPKLCDSAKVKTYTLISYMTYLFSYLLFPDGGDVGEMYLFFGLIQNNAVADITFPISIICFITHIIFTVFSLNEANKTKNHN